MGASDAPARGACYGWEIRSDLEFEYLRGGGGPPLLVEAGRPPEGPPGELLREWVPPLFPTHVRLHGEGDGYRLWIEDAGWFGVDPGEPRVTVPVDGDPLRREERVWGLPILLCFLERGDVPLHAACVEIDGRAVLLAGPRGFGKTTLAAAFATAGFRVLAEDLTCFRPGPEPTVVPGPAMLRIRSDVTDEIGDGGTTEIRRDGDRSHRGLTEGRGTCAPVPVGAVVFLSEADVDPTLEPVEGADVARDLWAVSFNLPTDEDRARCFRDVSKLAAETTAWRLARRLRVDDLGPTVARLVELMDNGPGG